MLQLIINPWRRSLGPWCRKKFKKFENIQKLEKIAIIFIKNADNKILKNILLHLEAVQ